MAMSAIDKRRKVRALESRRDQLLVMQTKNRDDLVTVRANLKHMRKAG